MPVVRMCYYCKKSFLKSSYQMLQHVEKCDKYLLHIEEEKKSKDSQSVIFKKDRTNEKQKPTFIIK